MTVYRVVRVGGADHRRVPGRAILHLSWNDVDWVPGRVTWRARYDKQGREWTQPLTLAAYSALLTARWWRQRDGERPE